MAAYNIIQTGASGLSMQATRVISRGEEIIREDPLVHLQIGLHQLYNSNTFWDKRVPHNGVQAVERAVAVLNRQDRDLFDNLHNCCGPAEGPGVGRILTNVFMEDEEMNHQTYKVLVVYNAISRVNHSCRPNAEHHWNPQTNTGSLHALRQIAAGEEIFIEYLGFRDSLSTRNERRVQLRDQWGFICQCDACVLRGSELAIDNDRREDARHFYDELDRPLQVSRSRLNMDMQRMGKLRQAMGYKMSLRQLNISDGRLAYGYERLAAINSDLYNAVSRDLPHSAECGCHRRKEGAVWHLRRAMEALSDMHGLDICTHGEGHPRVQRDVQAIADLSLLIVKVAL